MTAKICTGVTCLKETEGNFCHQRSVKMKTITLIEIRQGVWVGQFLLLLTGTTEEQIKNISSGHIQHVCFIPGVTITNGTLLSVDSLPYPILLCVDPKQRINIWWRLPQPNHTSAAESINSPNNLHYSNYPATSTTQLLHSQTVFTSNFK